MTVQTVIRDHALDGIALNHHQATLIANPTVEIDSLAEALTEIARGPLTASQRHHLLQALDLTRQVADANGLEAGHLRIVAGIADQLPTAGRAAPWGARRVAREVRDALANLTNPAIVDGPRREALQIVRHAITQSTRENVLSKTMLHEVGSKRYALLESIVNAQPVAA